MTLTSGNHTLIAIMQGLVERLPKQAYYSIKIKMSIHEMRVVG